MDGQVYFYHVPIVGRTGERREAEEAITEVTLASLATIWNEIRNGRIRDSFTLQAIALYDQRMGAPGR
jgi:hypothetical protein